MNLKNPFPREVINIYTFEYACSECGRCDRPLELHHILGRVSNSALNSILLCSKCHKELPCQRGYKEKWLEYTIRFLLSKNYQLTEKDIKFFEENRKLYK